MRRLIIDGEPMKSCNSAIWIDGERRGLPPEMFFMITVFAVATVHNLKAAIPDGYDPRLTTRYAHRLRKLITPINLITANQLPGFEKYGYIVDLHPRDIGFYNERLAFHPDGRVASLFQGERLQRVAKAILQVA